MLGEKQGEGRSMYVYSHQKNERQREREADGLEYVVLYAARLTRLTSAASIPRRAMVFAGRG